MNLTPDNSTLVYFSVSLWGENQDNEQGRDILLLEATMENRGPMDLAWIKPSSKSIDHYISGPNNELKARMDKQKIKLMSLEEAMKIFLKFLKEASKPVVLVGYPADSMLRDLYRAILQTDMVDQFGNVIAGFSDPSPIIRKKLQFSKRDKRWEPILGEMVITKELRDEIGEKCKSFGEVLWSEMETRYRSEILESLRRMQNHLTLGMLAKLAKANVAYSTLKKIYQRAGFQGLSAFGNRLQSNGKPRITDSFTVMIPVKYFFDYLQRLKLAGNLHQSVLSETTTKNQA